MRVQCLAQQGKRWFGGLDRRLVSRGAVILEANNCTFPVQVLFQYKFSPVWG